MSKQTNPTTTRRARPASAENRSSNRQQGASTRRRTTVDRSKPEITFNFPLDKTDGIVIAIGIAVSIIGYLLMKTALTDDIANNDGIWNNANAVTFAPILLTIGYCIIIPFGILRRRPGHNDAETLPEPTEG
jgi:hypothetical protein